MMLHTTGLMRAGDVTVFVSVDCRQGGLLLSLFDVQMMSKRQQCGCMTWCGLGRADQLRNQSQGDELEFHICQTASNIGMMWIRSTPGTIEMTQRWLEVIEGDPNKWDQVAFNDLKAEGKSCAGARDKDGARAKAEVHPGCTPSQDQEGRTLSFVQDLR